MSLMNFDNRSSTTNIAKPNVVYEEGESFPVFHYSFPLDWQFSVDEAYCIYLRFILNLIAL